MSNNSNKTIRLVFTEGLSTSRSIRNKTLWNFIDMETQMQCHTVTPLLNESSSQQNHPVESNASSSNLNSGSEDMFDDNIWLRALNFLQQLKLDETVSVVTPHDHPSFIVSEDSGTYCEKIATDNLHEEKDQYLETFVAGNNALVREIQTDINSYDKIE